MIVFDEPQAARITKERRSTTAASFARARRKEEALGRRLLSWHFEGDELVSQWGG